MQQQYEDRDDLKAGTPLTAAELLRNKIHRQQQPDQSKGTSNNEDIDEEIRRLEAELAVNSTSDDEDSSEDEEQVLCLSSVRYEKIEPLPKSLLPTAKSKPLKIDRGEIQSEHTDSNKKRRVEGSRGLEAAVKEVLDGYVARSSERIPFYCRFCAKQYANEEEFFAHKKSEFHLTAVEMERKTSFCKLCRKQLTSPAQLKEHLVSRPHKERLQLVRSKQKQHKR